MQRLALFLGAHSHLLLPIHVCEMHCGVAVGQEPRAIPVGGMRCKAVLCMVYCVGVHTLTADGV